MKIWKTINRVPGGLVVCPLFLGMVINTFFPHLLKIGGYTEGLSGIGHPTFLGMYLFAVGTKMTIRASPKMFKRGFGILMTKVGLATIFALVVAKLFHGSILGLSTLAIVVAMSDTNGGMFLALTSAMGDNDDAGTYVPQSIETGPFLTMVIFVGAGLANIPWLDMVSVIAPIFVGALLGNLDNDMRNFFGSHEPIIVPFMAFTLGQNINLRSVLTAGLPGILLGIMVFTVTGFCCIVADKLLGGGGNRGGSCLEHGGKFCNCPASHRPGGPQLCGDCASGDGSSCCPAPSPVALYCLSHDSQHNPRPRIAAGHSILTSLVFGGANHPGRQIQFQDRLPSATDSYNANRLA
jgi:2-keto-3-deoxygluconate permease